MVRKYGRPAGGNAERTAGFARCLEALERPKLGLRRFGANGVAELGVFPAGTALINSIHNAKAVRVLDMPVTLDKLLGDPPAI